MVVELTVLQNVASSSNIFGVLRHWIPGSTNCHKLQWQRRKIVMRKCLESVSLNDYGYNGGEL